MPEAAWFARPTVDPGNPHEMAAPDNLRRLTLHMGSLAARDGVDGLVLVHAVSTAQLARGFPAPPPSAIVHALAEFIWGMSDQ